MKILSLLLLPGSLYLNTAFNQKEIPGHTIHSQQSIVDTIPKDTVDWKASPVFTKTQVEPVFKGEEKAWKKFLKKNLNASAAVDNKAPEGEYKVYVQFIVEKDGSASEIRALSKHGYGMEEECVRLIKLAAWEPAKGCKML